MYSIMRPVKLPYRVSQGYGENKNVYPYGVSGHQGIDYAVVADSIIYACTDGKVHTTGTNHRWFGNYLVIEHDGFYSLYGHLNSFKVSKGQTVKQGDVVALSGNTGYTTGPHLHFGVGRKPLGLWFDPTEAILSWKEPGLSVSDIKRGYNLILGREVDEDGMNHFRYDFGGTYTDFLEDLARSEEHRGYLSK